MYYKRRLKRDAFIYMYHRSGCFPSRDSDGMVKCWQCGSNAHHPVADSTKDTSHRWENPARTGGVAYLGNLRDQCTPSAFLLRGLPNLCSVLPLDAYIISHCA